MNCTPTGGLGDDLVHGVVDASCFGIDVEEYLACRDAGATHSEILSVYGMYHTKMYDYARGRRSGASDCEVAAVLALGEEVDDYVRGLSYGCSHDEMLEIGRQMGDLGVYVGARRDGLCHEELLIICRERKVLLSDYVRGRLAGATRGEAFEVADKQLSLLTYARGRVMGRSHESALASCVSASVEWRSGVGTRYSAVGDVVVPADRGGARGRSFEGVSSAGRQFSGVEVGYGS
jgi:hypothetical protein